jgi:hypothetical protein
MVLLALAAAAAADCCVVVAVAAAAVAAAAWLLSSLGTLQVVYQVVCFGKTPVVSVGLAQPGCFLHLLHLLLLQRHMVD